LSRRTRIVLAALLGALVVAAPAQAQGPITAEAREGTGTATASGTWAAGRPYTATLQNTFTPSRIKPGESFTYDSVLTVHDHAWEGYPTSERTETREWGFARVPRGGTLWTSGIDDRTLTGQHTFRSASPPGQIVNTIKHVVPGAQTTGMSAGCYQSTNWESPLWFPGSETTAGQMGTLVVYDVEEGRWPTCGACPTGVAGQDDDRDGFKDVCDDLECRTYASGIDGCALVPGDILLDRGSNTNAITIANTLLGDTYWTHAAVVLGYMNLDHDDPDPTPADCEDVQPRFEGDDDPECELVIAEAVPNEKHEIRIRNIVETVWGDQDTDNTDWNVVRLGNVPSAVRRAAADTLKRHLLFGLGAVRASNHDRDCSVCDVKEWGASGGTYNVVGQQRGPTAFYCSSLVWWAYKQVGVDLDWDRFAFWPWELVEGHWVTPDELVSTPGTEPYHLRSPGPRGAVHAVFSPAHIMVIDSHGRRTGKDGAGTLHQEIPGTIWRDNGESESVSVQGNLEHDIRLSGFGTGKYTFVSSQPSDPYQPPLMAAGYTRPGQIEQVSSMAVSALAARPVAFDDAATVVPPEATVDVLENDLVPGEEVFVYMAESGAPAHGTATVVDNKIRYVPAPGYVGPDAFTYEACEQLCSQATVTLDVRPAPPGPDPTNPGGGSGPGGPSGPPGIPAAPGIPGPPPASGKATGGIAPGSPRGQATLTVVRRQRLKAAVRLKVHCPAACEIVADGRLGSTRVPRVRASLRARGEIPIRLRLRGRARRPGTFRLLVTVRLADGSSQRLRANVRLKR
jgi:hypothetical protein